MMNLIMPSVVILNVVMSIVVGPYRRIVLPTVGRLVALLTNIRLGRKNWTDLFILDDQVRPEST